MTQDSKRFKALDEEFNIALTTIKQSDPSIILNSASNELTNLSKDILKTLNEIARVTDPKLLLKKVNEYKNKLLAETGINKVLASIGDLNKAFRQAKSQLGSLIDVNKLGSKEIQNIVSALFKNDPLVQNLLKTIELVNGNKRIGKIPKLPKKSPVIFNPNIAPSIPTRKTGGLNGVVGVDYKSVIDILNRTTGTKSEVTVSEPNLAVERAFIIGSIAYDAKIPGVLAAIEKMEGMTKELLTKATELLLADQAANGNLLAVLDITETMESVGVTLTSSTSPSSIPDILENYALSGETYENFSLLVDSIFAALSKLKPGWNISKDNLLSTAVSNLISDDLKKVFQYAVGDYSFTEDAVRNANEDEETVFLCAFLSEDRNNINYLNTLGLSCSSCI